MYKIMYILITKEITNYFDLENLTENLIPYLVPKIKNIFKMKHINKLCLNN